MNRNTPSPYLYSPAYWPNLNLATIDTATVVRNRSVQCEEIWSFICQGRTPQLTIVMAATAGSRGDIAETEIVGLLRCCESGSQPRVENLKAVRQRVNVIIDNTHRRA